MVEGAFDRVSWSDFQELIDQLINQLKKYNFDAIVGITTGGWIPAAIIANEFDMKPYAIGIKYYEAINTPSDQPRIYQHLFNDVNGKVVLLVDDVADSGKTLELAKDYLYFKGAKSVILATLHLKPRSVITPEAFAAYSNKWIVYPWEKSE